MQKKVYKKRSPYEELQKPRSGVAYVLYLVSSLSITAGFLILASQFIWPYFSIASHSAYIRPVSNDYFSNLLAVQEGFSFNELGFSESVLPAQDVPTFFYLTIPKLGIKDAVIETNSQSLSPDTYLGHLTGSAVPSEKGEVVVYGHSTTPILFDATNYKTIFSKLDKLNDGDELIVTYSDKKYVYRVQNSSVVPPEEVSPLFKSTQQNKLLLVTCFPFGTIEDRLLVSATLVR